MWACRAGAIAGLSTAVVLSSAGMVYADHPENTNRAGQEVFGVTLLGGVPAFNVGPIDDGEPTTPDPTIGANGVRDLTISVNAAAGAQPNVVTVSPGGPATACPDDPDNIDQVVTVQAFAGAIVDVLVQYEEINRETGATSTQTIHEQRPAGADRTVRIPVCVIR